MRSNADLWPNSTVFWLLGADGTPYGAQVVLYDPGMGKRQKNGWIHTALKSRLSKKWQGSPEWLNSYEHAPKIPVPFGLHLLKESYQKPVAVVESAKTAVVMTAIQPTAFWLAVGGLSNLTEQRLRKVKDFEIVLYPDLGGSEQWGMKANILKKKGFKIVTSELLELNSKSSENKAGYDIADFFNKIVNYIFLINFLIIKNELFINHRCEIALTIYTGIFFFALDALATCLVSLQFATNCYFIIKSLFALMIEKKSLLSLLDAGEYKRVLNELKTIKSQSENVSKLHNDLDALNDKHENKVISRQKYRSELTKLVQSIRKNIEALTAQELKESRWSHAKQKWNLKRILVGISILGPTLVVILEVGGSFSEFTGFSLRDIFFSKNEVKNDTLNQVNVKTSGDKSPAINAPGGEVKIEYQELQPLKNATDKKNKTKN